MAKGGFRGMPGGMGGMNQAAMLKQAQKMQQEMLRMQEEQENKTFSAQSGGGMVSATVNGKHELLELKVCGCGDAPGHDHCGGKPGHAHGRQRGLCQYVQAHRRTEPGRPVLRRGHAVLSRVPAKPV